MYRIVDKSYFSPNVLRLEIEAPLIAKARKAGHFVIVRVDERGERIPLTIAGADVQRGTITLVVQKMGSARRQPGIPDKPWRSPKRSAKPTKMQ